LIKTHVITVGEGIEEASFASLAPDLVEVVLRNILDSARAFWIKRAGETLSSGRRDYINGIQPVRISGSVGTIALVGAFPLMIEEGASPYDMHTTLLGPNVPVVPVGSGMKGKHQGKKGFYRAIPFRHQSPTSIGQGGGAPMGSQYAGHPAVANAQKLGKAVYKEARKLGASTGMPGGPTTWGDRLPEGLAPKLKELHTTDIFAGMVRLEKTYEKATQSTYMTFRTISDAVPSKFHHPGIEAHHIADEVQDFVDEVAPLAFAALAGVGDDG
jgi:hypothetical protein